jgi:predicted ATPase/DNA-binding NarL/FixJ family response regulator
MEGAQTAPHPHARAGYGPARRQGDLPHLLHDLVGRDAELRRAEPILRSPHSRLLTVTGPPGVGKTCFAVELAWRVAGTFPHGVTFVDLSLVQDPTLVLRFLARSLRLVEGGGRSLREQIVDRLAPCQLLLVLDNFEHVVPASLELAYILSACADVKALVTSREPLHLTRETELPLQPLPSPDPGAAARPRALLGYPAVDLFVRRARAAAPGFTLTQGNAPAVAAICQRLEGLPLALELAAAQVKTKPPEAILAELGGSLAGLRSAAREAPERHRTLQHAVTWSDQLLSEPQRRLFRRLAVFAGGFTRQAALQVCADLPEVPAGITSLVDKNLLQTAEHEGEERLRMIAPVRESVLPLLRASGELAAASAAHALYLADFAATAAPRLRGPEQGAWLDRLERELHNFRAALSWLMAHRPDDALRTACNLSTFWYVRGHIREGREWLERALDAAPEDCPLRPEALCHASAHNWLEGRPAQARRCAAEAVRLTARGNPSGQALALFTWATVAPQDQADSARRRALAAAREAGNLWLLCAAGTLAAESAASVDLPLATRLQEEGVQIAGRLRDRYLLATALAAAADVAWRRGAAHDADHLYRDSLRYAHELGNPWTTLRALEGLACTAAAAGRLRRATLLLGAAEAARQRVGTPDLPGPAAPCLRDLGQRLARPALQRARQAGRALFPDDAVNFALMRDELPPSPAGNPVALSEREREVAVLVALGRTNRQIARELVISERTAESHVQSIFNKLGFHRRSEIAAWVARHDHSRLGPGNGLPEADR